MICYQENFFLKVLVEVICKILLCDRCWTIGIGRLMLVIGRSADCRHEEDEAVVLRSEVFRGVCTGRKALSGSDGKVDLIYRLARKQTRFQQDNKTVGQLKSRLDEIVALYLNNWNGPKRQNCSKIQEKRAFQGNDIWNTPGKEIHMVEISSVGWPNGTLTRKVLLWCSVVLQDKRRGIFQQCTQQSLLDPAQRADVTPLLLSLSH